MNSDCFRVLRQRLMEKLDLARELSDEEILEASEVFPLPDGRFLIVEG